MVVQSVHHSVREFLNRQSLPYRDGLITFDQSEEPFLASHVDELRLCDTDFDASVPNGMRLMSWQVRHPSQIIQIPALPRNVYQDSYSNRQSN